MQCADEEPRDSSGDEGALEPAGRLLGDVLDVLPQGVLVVARDGQVSMANPAARAALAEHPALLLRSGRIVARHDADSRRLSAALGRAAGTPASTELVGFGAQRRGSQVLITGTRSGGSARSGVAAAIVYVGGHIDADTGALARLGTIFALTETEARITLQLCLGFSVQQVATQRGVSTHTVRSQLRNIYAKASVDGQQALVRQSLTSVAFHRVDDESIGADLPGS